MDQVRRYLAPALFIAPGMLLYLVFIVYPMLQAVAMSLFDWQVVAGAVSVFRGLDNYARALADPRVWLSLSNSGVYMLFTVPPQIALGLGVALLLKDKSPAQPFFRVLYYLPVVTSWVVVSLLFKYLFADKGLINWGLGLQVSWLSDRWTAMVAICALGVWKGIGWSMMIFLAALQGVPQALIEASKIDGAGPWMRFRTVTIPAIWPTVAFVTIMLVIGGLNVFTSVQNMTGGAPGGDTDVVLTYMYRQAFEFLDFGYGSAIAVLLTLLVFALSAIQLRFFRNETMA
ncbi:MAG: sugar ABC transporter permease [Devosia nanyangense]|uniref:Sugar ABC transporter permease n=1 Tax=Devosia nanyangense TaxID=1228055 RepID=A0A933L6V6_9HYPH|nr:sugar ABC transporter permease [Devosia nanyangense]